MSTLTISIIALVVVVVGAVALFNVWQARGSRSGPRSDLRSDRPKGQQENRLRYDRLEGVAGRTGKGVADEQAGSRRWHPGPEQNAWARQRREPTLLADDEPDATARVARGFEDRRHAASPAESDPQGERDAYMTADDDVAAERMRAEEARRAEQGFGEPQSRGARDWDTGLLPDPDEELGPPEFETPRFDAASLGPLKPEGPRLDPADPPGRSPPGFENTRPFANGAPADTRPAASRADGGNAGDAGDVAHGAGHADGPSGAADGEDAGAVPDAVRPSVYVPAEIDHVVTLIPRAPVNAERLIALTSSLRHVGSKSVRIEIDNGQGRWVPLQSGVMVGCLRCAVLLANRQGPLNAVELSDFSAAMESLAGQIGARFVPTDMNQVLRQARHLDTVAAKLDTQVDLGVEASAPVSAEKLASVARQLDLADRGGGRFACFAEGGERLYTLMPGETSDMLAFVLDVPRTPAQCDPWRSMVACATSCAQLVGGRIVDGAGRGMSVSMIETVGQQLQKRYEELSKVGLKAGSPAALRLFN